MLSGVCVFVIWWYPMVSEGIHSITFLSTEGYYSSIFYIFQCFTWNIFNFIFFDPGNVSRETLPGTDCQKIIFASLLENLNFFESSDFSYCTWKTPLLGFFHRIFLPVTSAAYGLFDILILSMFHVKHWQAVSRRAYQHPQPSDPDAAQGRCHNL